MPSLTLAEIDVLLAADTSFMPGRRNAEAWAAIDRLLDMRLQCGLERETT
jgi:hypothetical protein